MDGMNAKLIKLENGEYDLLVDTNLKNLSDTKLSLKNCEAIANGYDLDELADENVSDIHEANTDFMFKDIYREYFKEGFQKALELMGHNKYSEDDVIKIAEYIRVSSQSSPSVRTKYLLAEYQSQQQDEWDVEIEMWFHGTRHKKGEWIPKLDENGCLILKRV